MRRSAASLLLFIAIFLPLQPLLAVLQTESQLPACCRRNGAHHCSMAAALAAQTAVAPQPAFTSPPCPWKFTAPSALVFTLHASHPLFSQPVAARITASLDVFFFSTRIGSRSARAPPATLL